MAKPYRNPSDNYPSLRLRDEASGRSTCPHSNKLQIGRHLPALGALGLGALALGAFAIGAVAIGRMAIGRARIRRMEIDELTVRSLSITESLKTPPNVGPGSS